MATTNPTQASNPQSALFTQAANNYLRQLHLAHARNLSSGADDAIRSTTHSARVVKRAVVVHSAIHEICSIPPESRSDTLEVSCGYLRGASARMQAALRDGDIKALNTLSMAAESVLDDLADGNAFEEVVETEFDEGGDDLVKKRSLFRKDTKSNIEGDTIKTRTFCGLSCAELSRRDKIVLWLYLFMVIGAIVAVTAVTVDFAQQQINPGAFIQSDISDSLPAPVVTVCLSQTGIPFSRLQLFNFTDAEGEVFQGADPQGEQSKRQGPNFESVVERFWDNPRGEDCDSKVGDFFPLPLNSLNDLTSGRTTTECRPCYRVGAKQIAIARSTAFNASSILAFWTDNYFLQCMKSKDGLVKAARDLLYEQLLERSNDESKIETLGEVLSTTGNSGLSLEDLELENFAELTSEQLCNVFYFGLFPRELDGITPDPNIDIRYAYDGSTWTEIGGPYFKQTESDSFFPEDSLQMFVGTQDSAIPGALQKDRDMILIGPNTQTYATFRPIIVYGNDRYDIASSTTNLRDGVFTLFGYWLKYKIFYNYVRFVTDEYYRQSTYPASQWIVDLTGYATLFTGASLFSLLLLPLLRTMRRREKQRLLKQRPEVYLWGKHRRKAGGEVGPATPAVTGVAGTTSRGGGDDDDLFKNDSVMLPGYNL